MEKKKRKKKTRTEKSKKRIGETKEEEWFGESLLLGSGKEKAGKALGRQLICTESHVEKAFRYLR